jgi:hypothetical protein
MTCATSRRAGGLVGVLHLVSLVSPTLARQTTAYPTTPGVFTTKLELITALGGGLQSDDPPDETTHGPVAAWDVTGVTDFSGLRFDKVLFNVDMTGWTTSQVTDTYNMLFNNFAFNQPLAWDMGGVTNMGGMFSNAVSFNQPLEWDVRSVISGGMLKMFNFDACTEGAWDYGTNTCSQFITPALSDCNKRAIDDSLSASTAWTEAGYWYDWIGLCPPPPSCKPWCEIDNSAPWSTKCAWTGCALCAKCAKCGNWCTRDSAPWSQKCSWVGCKACDKCSAACDAGCAQHKKPWHSKCTWARCSACDKCEAHCEPWCGANKKPWRGSDVAKRVPTFGWYLPIEGKCDWPQCAACDSCSK